MPEYDDLELKDHVDLIIENTIKPSFRRFVAYLSENDATLIKNLDFTQSSNVNYSDENIQDLYIIRFFYAYFYEYYELFSTFFKLIQTDQPINIISLGCGCCIDYFGYQLARSEVFINSETFYTGIDLIDWKKATIWDLANQRFKYQNILDFSNFNEFVRNDCINVIVFPNSLYEFYQDDLIEKVSSTNFPTNKLCFVSTFRENFLEQDKTNFNKIINGFVDRNNKYFHTRISINNHKYPETKGIYGIDRDFVYPDFICTYMKMDSIKQNCGKYRQNHAHCNPGCFSNSSFKPNPMLKYKYLKYQCEILINDN